MTKPRAATFALILSLIFCASALTYSPVPASAGGFECVSCYGEGNEDDGYDGGCGEVSIGSASCSIHAGSNCYDSGSCGGPQ